MVEKKKKAFSGVMTVCRDSGVKFFILCFCYVLHRDVEKLNKVKKVNIFIYLLFCLPAR